MPKRTDIQSILVVGAGPIIIGQACEFDYSGTQACKVLKEEGYKVILVNSNPATIMTDPSVADATYIEPITPEVVERIIEKERPDAILPTVGGQTALNTSLELFQRGVLQKYHVDMIGADAKAIEKAENREKFGLAMEKIGLKTPKNAIVHTMAEAMEAVDEIGLPAIIRPSFTLGGRGGGVAETREQFRHLVKTGLDASPVNEIQIDQSVLGWKEFEMEVIRDKNDNAIIICSIENIDPMGIHTGDSITVAPALTLTDKEYQTMRDASIAVLREIGVETGGSNVQFAVNPANGEMLVIEMNPRVSRSSALASKATGFPIAKVAARLAVGYALDEIKNDITKVTPASFEPSIDYVVTKIPRFTFEKFKETDPELTTAMKSVGEVMAIGRNFNESLQKAFRSLEMRFTGLDEVEIPGILSSNSKEENTKVLKAALRKRSPYRILQIAQAIRLGMDPESIHEATRFDPWFIEQLSEIVAEENRIKSGVSIKSRGNLLHLKKLGFSDARIGQLTGKSELEVAETRRKLHVHPVFKRIDTCAAEFQSYTSYMYSCYEGNGYMVAQSECNPSWNNKVIILGGGPNRIGQGIEFDYTCVHACYTLAELGFESIMVNCNPETVSTDYDTADRLYFEPLTGEDVLEIIKAEQEKGSLVGVIVQLGGQTPLNLASFLEEAGVPILGTSPKSIEHAEDRNFFKNLIQRLHLKQPRNGIAHNLGEIHKVVKEIGYPIVIRPSFVLGGKAMRVISDEDSLNTYLQDFGDTILDGPILIDQFLQNATEVDVDALSDGKDVFVAGIMEHIEEAGVHSGDSACSIPPYSLSKKIIREIRKQTVKLAKDLGVIGLMNVQYAIKGEEIYVLEVNPRASRTVPFVAKATGIPVANIAVGLITGKPLSFYRLSEPVINHFNVKETIFPFSRFPKSDLLLGPEMLSTGEVMGIDKSFPIAFKKAQMAVNNFPSVGNAFVELRKEGQDQLTEIANRLQRLGYVIFARGVNYHTLKDAGICCNEVSDERITGMLNAGEIKLFLNTVEKNRDETLAYNLRQQALLNSVPYYTTYKSITSLLEALESSEDFTFTSVQDLYPACPGDRQLSKIRLFVRQSFTEAGDKESWTIQEVLETLKSFDGNRYDLDILTGLRARSGKNFKLAFENKTGVPFTPKNFRKKRRELLAKSDAMVVIRTGLSESTAFEIAYNLFEGKRVPIFFAIADYAPIKTTLLKELEEYTDVVYCTFNEVSQLKRPLQAFLDKVVMNQN